MNTKPGAASARAAANASLWAKTHECSSIPTSGETAAMISRSERSRTRPLVFPRPYKRAFFDALNSAGLECCQRSQSSTSL
jgi:hypothetical protein